MALVNTETPASDAHHDGSAGSEDAMRTVLVADDDPDIRGLVATKLERAGYHVVQAADGDQAVARAAESAPDLAVLDVSMPGMSGIEVCRRIRGNPRTRTMPVIMLSAHDEATATTLGYVAGADLYLGKPYSPRQIVSHVGQLIAKHERELAQRAEEAARAAPAPAPKRRLFGRRPKEEHKAWY